MQDQIAIEELLRRWPDFVVDIDARVYAKGHYVRRHKSLPWSAG
jgi:hypothetical protein